jgi:hypothetical protein
MLSLLESTETPDSGTGNLLRNASVLQAENRTPLRYLPWQRPKMSRLLRTPFLLAKTEGNVRAWFVIG